MTAAAIFPAALERIAYGAELALRVGLMTAVVCAALFLFLAWRETRA